MAMRKSCKGEKHSIDPTSVVFDARLSVKVDDARDLLASPAMRCVSIDFLTTPPFPYVRLPRNGQVWSSDLLL